MLLYIPSDRQIKSLALACIKVWPDAEDVIWKAAALVGVESIVCRESPTGTPYLVCRSGSSDKEYPVTMQWVPSDILLSRRSRMDVTCSCRAYSYNTVWLDHHGEPQRCCTHTLALLMYRRLIEDAAALLDYPIPPGVTWHPAEGLDRFVLDQNSLIQMAYYLALHQMHPAELTHAEIV